jgi:hypothetical protein
VRRLRRGTPPLTMTIDSVRELSSMAARVRERQ